MSAGTRGGWLSNIDTSHAAGSRHGLVRGGCIVAEFVGRRRINQSIHHHHPCIHSSSLRPPPQPACQAGRQQGAREVTARRLSLRWLLVVGLVVLLLRPLVVVVGLLFLKIKKLVNV